MLISSIIAVLLLQTPSLYPEPEKPAPPLFRFASDDIAVPAPSLIPGPDKVGPVKSPSPSPQAQKPASVSPATPTPPTPAPRPILWRLTDAWGQTWLHQDKLYLESWVARRNAVGGR